MTLLDRIKKLPYTPLQLAIHLYVWQGLGVLLFQFLTNHLTANPLQAIQQRTGRHALTLLVLSLACAPLSNITGWRELLKRSRTLGLYAFMVAFLHILVFLDLDNGIAWDFFVQTVIEKWYIIFGFTAFILLDPPGHDLLRHLEGAPRQEVEAAAPACLYHRAHRGPALCPVGKRRHLPSGGRYRRPLIYGLIVADPADIAPAVHPQVLHICARPGAAAVCQLNPQAARHS